MTTQPDCSEQAAKEADISVFIPLLLLFKPSETIEINGGLHPPLGGSLIRNYMFSSLGRVFFQRFLFAFDAFFF